MRATSVWLVDSGSHVQAYNGALAAALREAGCRVWLWATPPAGPGRRRRLGATAVHPLRLAALVSRAARERPQIAHFQWCLEPPLEGLAMRRLEAVGVRTVMTVHNVLPHEERPWQSELHTLLYRAARRLVAHSHATAERIAGLAGLDRSRIEVIPMAADRPTGPPIDRNDARARLGLDLGPADRLVLFFGQIRPYKGLDVLLAAMHELRRADRSVHLLVAGSVNGAGRRTPGTASRADPSRAGVIWRTGRRPESEVPLLFAASDVVALPYLDTSDSAVLPQALAHGRAVVASSVGGLPEAVSRGGGLLVVPGDPRALAAAVGRVLSDAELCHRLEAEALAATRAWTWRDVAQATCRIYDELAGEDRDVR
jgi:glycosyltransferase involved in cell wall biosynthesis